MKLKHTIRAAAAALAAVVLLSGCAAPAGKASGSQSSLPSVVKIGTQQMPDDEEIAVAKNYFQDELGVKVNIIEFQAGDIRNAMIAKNIDFALLGSSSASLGIASGMNAEVIWVHEILGTAEELVARNGSGIHSVRDLKGKRVAAPFTSTSHYSLLRALKLNGVSDKDVTLLDMQMPDIYAAWQHGDIDAAYGWDPTLSSLLKNGTAVLSSKDLAAKGIVTANVEIVRKDFAQKYPNLVARYIKAVDRAVELYRSHQPEAVQTIADALKITPAEALKQTQGSEWLSAKEQLSSVYLGTSSKKGRMVDSLKDMADFLYEQKDLPSPPVRSTFEQAVNPSYVEQALQ